ncbi:MAG: hypothetical protein WBN09_12260 [Woeseiaceae bacterium]
MRVRSLLFCLFALPALAFADASDGQFMGYELDKASPDATRAGERTATGNLLVVAQNPIKPADIREVTLVTTPVTRTVGYISAASWFATEEEARASARRYVELLRVKYPDWTFGGEVLDASLRIVEVSLVQAPYNLKFRLGRDVHEGREMWRFSMGLGWLPDAAERRAWQEKASAEQASEDSSEREQILKDSDVRGL